MASLSKGTSFTDGVTGDVTAAKLHALVDAATPVGGLISDRTAKTSVASADTLLLSDSADSENLKKITVSNLVGTLPTASITTGTILTATLGTTTGTSAIFTSGTLTTGVIPTATFGTTTGTAATFTSGTIPALTAGTTISTAANITNGTVQTLTASTATITGGTYFGAINSTAGTIGTLNNTAGTIGTLNSTAGTIGNFTTTLAGDFAISNGTGTLGTSGVTAGTYGTSTVIPRITVDAKGRVTSMGTSALGSTGKVLQVVKSSTASVITCGTTIPWDDTIPQITEGNEVLTVSITPLSATSTIYLKFDASGSASGAVTNSAAAAIFKDSTANAIYATQLHFWNATNYGIKFVASYSEASGGTTARTYRIRIGADSPTIYINANNTGVRRYGGVSIAQFEAWEVEA